MPIAIPQPSQEQERALNLFADGHNILVNSVAGGGKTTFILHLAQRARNRAILFLTYNKRLQVESRARARAAGITHLLVRTFHAYCASAYAQPCCNDVQMYALSREKISDPAQYGIIVIDEMQDITPILFSFLMRVIQSQRTQPQICVVGDQYQTIYEYVGADARAFVHFSELVGIGNFARCEFRETFRCTNQMAQFINALLGYERIISHREGPRVRMICTDMKSPHLRALICAKYEQYGSNRFFVLTPSSKSHMIANIVSDLSRNTQYSIYCDNTREEPPPEEITRGKLCIFSYHQSKGLERQCVIVLGFEDTYYDNIARNEPRDRLCNAQYVALTRARNELIVVRDNHSLPMRFFSERAAQVAIVERFNGPAVSSRPNGTIYARSVVSIVSHKAGKIFIRAHEMIHEEVLCEPEQILKPFMLTKGREGCIEMVADITGVAIPLCSAIARGHDMVSIMLENYGKSLGKSPTAHLNQYWPSRELNTVEGKLQFATFSQAVQSGFFHKANQITCWNWITEDDMARAITRLDAEIDSHAGVPQFEVHKDCSIDDNIIQGIVDCIVKCADAREIYYEIKCATQLKDEHYAQLAMYAFLFFDPLKQQEFRLFNVFTGELRVLRGLTREICDDFARLMLIDVSSRDMGDTDFIECWRRYAEN